MDTLSVTIQRFVDDNCRGFEECLLIDADGYRDLFVEKDPIVSAAKLPFDSAMPQPGHIARSVEDEWMDDLGRKLVCFSAEEPWDIESVGDQTSFTVLSEQVLRG